MPQRRCSSRSLFYAWKKLLLNSANRVFENRTGKKDNAHRLFEEQNQRLKNVIAEITAENLDLKKGLSA